MPEPAYTRLAVDERRRQIIEAGTALFTEHAYEEISMRRIAAAAGVSKPLLYHYFPSKLELFTAATADAAAQLLEHIQPADEGTALERLAGSLDAYLAWIEDNRRTWTKLMASAASLPEAGDFVDGFRARTTQMLITGLAGDSAPSPSLRTAVTGWLGFVDAAILDWTETGEITRGQLRDLLLTAFAGAVMAARQIDPELRIAFG